MPLDPPLPVSAVLNEAASELVLTFDKAMIPGFLVAGLVGVVGDTFDWGGDGGEILAGTPTVARFDLDPAKPGTGPPFLTEYTADPPALVGTGGAPVAPFIDFPTTLI